jgi:hypothetical protein
VGGGGGAAKTGVKNGFEVLELGHDGKRTTAESVTRFETGAYAVMNQSAAKFSTQSALVAVGHDEHCQVYRVQMARKNKGAKGANGEPRQNGMQSPIGFDFYPVKKIQTDYK